MWLCQTCSEEKFYKQNFSSLHVSKVNNSICVGNSDGERYLGIAVYPMNIFGRYEAANYVVYS